MGSRQHGGMVINSTANISTIPKLVGVPFRLFGYNVYMAKNSTISRYSRLAPASAVIAGALHSASSRMGHHLELALASELVASEMALPWSGGMAASTGSVHRFVVGPSMSDALRLFSVSPGKYHALPDLWFMSGAPSRIPSYIIQLKSGGRISKSHRSGEAAALSDLASRMCHAGLPVHPVLCAFDAQTDTQAVSALGSFVGIKTLSGPSLCLFLGIDYDRVAERWEGCAGDTLENDQQLARGLYASMVAHYGKKVAEQVWQQASGQSFDC